MNRKIFYLHQQYTKNNSQLSDKHDVIKHVYRLYGALLTTPQVPLLRHQSAIFLALQSTLSGWSKEPRTYLSELK
jgi:hypothetical protein